MIELRGKYNVAKVFTDDLESEAVSQIINLLNQEFVADCKIRIMPDAHAGAGCTIGTTMTITDKIVPNLVGVDIGCGMETARLSHPKIDLQALDQAVHTQIPSGFSVRESQHAFVKDIDLTALRCRKHVDIDRAALSLGTLGGGNHFIELGRDESGALYLVVHSGSRHLGLQVAKHYQNAAAKQLRKNADVMQSLIASLKKQGRESEIQTQLRNLGLQKMDKDLAYCEGALFDDYLHDMEIVQRYASLNRRAIISEIVAAMRLEIADSFTTVHNYIDLESMILRKGAISAKEGERVLIPMNMRDGSLLCSGKGNPDWNHSAPHGAGRLMSRNAAKSRITLEEFEQSMEGIYSTTVNSSTLDEAPSAYKPMQEIIQNIGGTVEINGIIKPIYNFKAAE